MLNVEGDERRQKWAEKVDGTPLALSLHKPAQGIWRSGADIALRGSQDKERSFDRNCTKNKTWMEGLVCSSYSGRVEWE